MLTLRVRGMEGIKEAAVDLNGTEVKVAIAHGLSNARKLMDQVRSGESLITLLKLWPVGWMYSGGGSHTKANKKRAEHIEAIYVEDEGMPIRKSHENPEVKIIYDEFLHEPLGHKSHELLHTHYHTKNKRYL